MSHFNPWDEADKEERYQKEVEEDSKWIGCLGIIGIILLIAFLTPLFNKCAAAGI